MSERTSAVPTTAHLDCTALLARLPTAGGERSIEAFRHGSLLVKLYAPRGHDPQTPHTRDEAFSDDLAVWVLSYGPEGGELGRSESGDPAP